MVKTVQITLVGILLSIGLFFDYVSNDLVERKGLYYDHVEYSDNVNYYGTEDLNLKYSAELSKVGDSYSLSFDVVNDTNVDMKIVNVEYPKDDSYITYQLMYSDGSIIHSGDVISKGESRGIQYVVTYEKPIQDNDYEFDSSFHIGYEQVLY